MLLLFILLVEWYLSLLFGTATATGMSEVSMLQEGDVVDPTPSFLRGSYLVLSAVTPATSSFLIAARTRLHP